MWIVRFVLKAAAAALFLLCMLVPQYNATSSIRAIRSAASQDVLATPLWKQSSHDIVQFAAAVPSKLEDFIANCLPLPSWKKIVSSADAFLKVTDQGLNDVARELNLSDKIEDFRSTLHNIVSNAGEIRGHMDVLIQTGLTANDISDELGAIFHNVLEHLKTNFPPPDQAPGHEERQRMMKMLLDRAEEGLLDLCRKHDMAEDKMNSVRESFDRMRLHIEKLVVITGDLIEQHPILFSAVVVSVTAMLIPEEWLLRPLLSLMGFGPSGPIKGSPAAWIQSRFWGAAVTKGSWFAILQRAGMKGGRFVFIWFVAVIGGLFGI